jgi:very-short-patch-repair endonuclease
MRAEATDAESLLWSELRRRQLGVRFRRQHPIGGYIVDFVCLEHRLVVESDGFHHGGTYDAARDEFLRSCGFEVRRFWSSDVIRDRDGVVEEIAIAVQDLGLLPPSNRPTAD